MGAARSDIDPGRFAVHVATRRGLRQAYLREGIGGVPLVCVHGWPETKRIFWRVVGPLADAGFEVVVPDLRGFGDSGVGPDGFHDVVTHADDVWQLVHDELGHDRVVLLGGDLGGPVIQHLALARPDHVDRMVLFNSPLPYLHDEMRGLDGTRPAQGTTDYFVRQGTDADGLLAELATPAARIEYVASFYTGRGWAHPGAFDGAVEFHSAPFADAARFRAGLGAYESVFDAGARSGEALFTRNPHTPTLILHGPSDRVIPPAFDRMAAIVFARHRGPFRVRDCGHFVPWEAPDALVTRTVEFCADLLSRSRSAPR